MADLIYIDPSDLYKVHLPDFNRFEDCEGGIEDIEDILNVYDDYEEVMA